MFGGISALVIHPDAFFARISKEKINLIPPLAIVGAGILLFTLIYVLIFIGSTGSGYSPDNLLGNSPLLRGIFLSFISRSIITPFLVWGVFSGVLYILPRIIGGDGSLFATIQNVGYGMLPWPVSVIFPVLYYIQRFNSPGGIIGCGIWFMPGELCTVPLIIMMIWSCSLWIFAIRHTHGLSLARAAAITIIPVGLILLVCVPGIA
jgi:hypothetical protein